MSAVITDEQRFLLLPNDRESLQNRDLDPVPWSKTERQVSDGLLPDSAR